MPRPFGIWKLMSEKKTGGMYRYCSWMMVWWSWLPLKVGFPVECEVAWAPNTTLCQHFFHQVPDRTDSSFTITTEKLIFGSIDSHTGRRKPLYGVETPAGRCTAAGVIWLLSPDRQTGALQVESPSCSWPLCFQLEEGYSPGETECSFPSIEAPGLEGSHQSLTSLKAQKFNQPFAPTLFLYFNTSPFPLKYKDISSALPQNTFKKTCDRRKPAAPAHHQIRQGDAKSRGYGIGPRFGKMMSFWIILLLTFYWVVCGTGYREPRMALLNSPLSTLSIMCGRKYPMYMRGKILQTNSSMQLWSLGAIPFRPILKQQTTCLLLMKICILPMHTMAALSQLQDLDPSVAFLLPLLERNFERPSSPKGFLHAL